MNAGRRVVTTRDVPGPLDEMLAAAGAEVVHVPLIAIGEPADRGRGLEAALATLDTAEWLVVTSQHGARRVGDSAGAHADLCLAAVGARTAAVLGECAGRPVDLVPARQTAADLVAAFPPPSRPGARVVVAQADRAETTLVDGLTGLGYDVTATVAYRTLLRRPTPDERTTALAADAVVFASGSAVRAWREALGQATPPVVAAIGPSTARVGAEVGLKITHVPADHDLEGLVREVMAALAQES